MWLCSPGVHHPSNTAVLPWNFPFSWHCPWHHISIWSDRPRILFERLLKLNECKCVPSPNRWTKRPPPDRRVLLPAAAVQCAPTLVLKNLILAGYNQFARSLGWNITILVFLLPLFDFNLYSIYSIGLWWALLGCAGLFLGSSGPYWSLLGWAGPNICFIDHLHI